MSQRPPIPERYSLLMPGSVQENLEVIKTRKASAMSALSALSASSQVSDFLAHKIETLSQGVEYQDEYLEGLRVTLHAGELSQEDFDQELSSALATKKEMRERVVAKRQRKFIQEDMEEEEGLQNRLESAYAQSMMNRVMIASRRPPKSHFDQKKVQTRPGRILRGNTTPGRFQGSVVLRDGLE